MGSSLTTPIAPCSAQKQPTYDDDDSEEEPLTARGSKNKRVIPRKPVDFVGQGLIPDGWRLSDEPVPAGFGLVGGCSVVIVCDEHAEGSASKPEDGADAVASGVPPINFQRAETTPRSTSDTYTTGGVPPINFQRAGLTTPPRVLMALPDWAVDLARAQWLTRLPQGDDWKMMLHLFRVTAMESLELVLFEFALPPACSQNLAVVLKEAPLKEDVMQKLYHDFLRLLLCLPSLRLWGLLRPELIFLDGQHRLASLLPLGQLLSFAGARAAIRAAPGVASELVMALALEDGSFADDRSRSLEVDAFGVAALAVMALGGADSSIQLSEDACNLLERSFQQDPKTRLSAGKAMLHPWLAMNEPPELFMSPRVTACTPRQGSKACRTGALGGILR